MIIRNQPLRGPVQITVPFLRQAVPMGQAIQQFTRSLGVKPCDPCAKRAAALNRRFVFVPLR